MEKSEIRILIVEDDPSFGASLAEVFKRAGYEAKHVLTPDQALTACEQFEFHALVIDCMLPRMNGVDLALEIFKRLDPRPPLILMTGIFRDKSFIKDAIVKTGAVDLLTKPFHHEKLVALLAVALEDLVERDLYPLTQLLSQPDCTSKNILEALQAQSSIHAYQLPLLFSLFARQGMTGEMSIITTDKDVALISIIEGKIVEVKSKNPFSQMGNLLIEFGFASPEDVEEALADSRNEPLGQKLIQAGALSPHAVGLIREEQLAIRLSQLISDTSVEVAWMQRDIKMQKTYHPLPPSRLKALMSDWIKTKIPAEWLRSFYLPLSERAICWRGKATIKIEGAKLNMPLLPEILESIQNQPTLQSLMANAEDKDLDYLQAIHALVLERKIYFGEKQRNANEFQLRIKRYLRLLDSLKLKDLFQILGVSQQAKYSEIQRSYTELAKTFHPDKIPPEAPEELREICHQIFSNITLAYRTLSDDARKQVYLDELSRKEAGKIFEFEPIFEAAIHELKAQHYKSAARKFDNLLAGGLNFPDIHAYAYWAKIKAGSKRVAEKDFFEIPPEHRHSPIYLMAKGLYYKSIGQQKKALECFQNARFMDKRFSEAHREVLELIDENKDKDHGVNTFFSKIIGKSKKVG
jgi:CheY-like chemotaxis protein